MCLLLPWKKCSRRLPLLVTICFKRTFSPGKVHKRLYMDSTPEKYPDFPSEQEAHSLRIWENRVFIKFLNPATARFSTEFRWE